MTYSKLKIPRAGAVRSSYSCYGYYSHRVPVGDAELLAVQLRRWARLSRTVGDSARCTTTVELAGKRSFRLVDGHGRTHGRRYTATGAWHQIVDYCRDYERQHQVLDQHDNERMLPARTRVRIVDQQEEDPHSRISRMLKAAHRSAA